MVARKWRLFSSARLGEFLHPRIDRTPRLLARSHSDPSRGFTYSQSALLLGPWDLRWWFLFSRHHFPLAQGSFSAECSAITCAISESSLVASLEPASVKSIFQPSSASS
jgi:hypothetical protein